jgi:hypothetical protein
MGMERSARLEMTPSGRTMKRWLLKVAFRIGMPLALWPMKLLDSPRSKALR